MRYFLSVLMICLILFGCSTSPINKKRAEVVSTQVDIISSINKALKELAELNAQQEAKKRNIIIESVIWKQRFLVRKTIYDHLKTKNRPEEKIENSEIHEILIEQADIEKDLCNELNIAKASNETIFISPKLQAKVGGDLIGPKMKAVYDTAKIAIAAGNERTKKVNNIVKVVITNNGEITKSMESLALYFNPQAEIDYKKLITLINLAKKVRDEARDNEDKKDE